jgi:hypothetical protein
MNTLARIRHQLARRPWLYWLGVTALAAGAGLVIAQATERVDEARRAWGRERTVLVATVDAEPGDALAAVVVRRSLPAPIVPAAALEQVAADAVARQRIRAGEVVVDHDVAPTAHPQAIIPSDWQAVAVAEPVPTGVVVGDHVSAASGGVVLAPDGVVVGQLADAVLVAVPADVAAQVAHAAITGELALLVRG